MFQEIKPDQYEAVRSLFSGFDYSLSIHAAIEGNNPGRIFVDDVNDPQTALALTVEGYLLAGETGNQEIITGLRDLLQEKIFTGEVFVNGDWSMSLAVHPQLWEAILPTLIPTHEMVKLERFHYLSREVKFDWRSHIPKGYSVHRVDNAFLDDPDNIFPGPLSDWMDFEGVWWTKKNFSAKGISYAVLQGKEVAAWCTPDCIAGDRIDIGIITHPAHRRRGLAAVVVAATAEECFSQGFSSIGWHCNTDNIGSWKTAEKVGFNRNMEYAYYYYVYDPIDHLAELGWYYYRRGEYARTVEYYEQVFQLRGQNADYYYHLASSAWALLGNKEKSLLYLQKAIDSGWTNIDFTKAQEEFDILHDRPEWDAILARAEGSDS